MQIVDGIHGCVADWKPKSVWDPPAMTGWLLSAILQSSNLQIPFLSTSLCVGCEGLCGHWICESILYELSNLGFLKRSVKSSSLQTTLWQTNTYELCDAKIYLQPVFHLDLWKHFVGVLKAIWDFWKGLWRAWNSPLQTFHLVCVLFIDFGIFIPNLALILFSQDLSISNHLQVWKAR